MVDKVLKTQAFKLKGRLYTLTVLSLVESDRTSFSHQLQDVVSQAPQLFKRAPVVLDCSAVKEASIDLQDICALCKQYGLIPIAIQGGSAMLETLAHCEGLAVLTASSNHDKPIVIHSTSNRLSPPNGAATKIIHSPVRSGQQVVSHGDLIVTAAVSHGAELLADGHIHVYGALRGRALAGIAGNQDTRIFCQSLEAELVSIAGFYRLSDSIEPIIGPCQIYLKDEQIQIETL